MTIYVCGALSETTHVELKAFDMFDWSLYLENGQRLPLEKIKACWRRLELVLHGIRKKGAVVQDAYQIGYFSGISLILSERFCRALEVRFPGQCTFLPVSLDKAGVDFFALWANNVRDDALNVGESELVVGPGSIINVRRYSFEEARLGNLGVFRLSPRYSGVEDLVTQPFVDFVVDHGFVGFTFWNRATGIVLEP